MDNIFKDSKDLNPERKHTILGITSFGMTVIFFFIWLIVLGLSSMFYKSTGDTAPIMNFLGWMIIGSFLLFIISLSLGIVAAREESALKIFPIMTISISSISLIATIIIIVIGILLP